MVDGQPAAAGPLLRLRVRLPRPREGHRAHRRSRRWIAAPRKRPARGGRRGRARQAQAVSGLEQLADIAVNALAQKDKVIASDAIVALRSVLVDYLTRKQALRAGLVRHRRARCATTPTSWRWPPSRWRTWRATAPGSSGRGCGRSGRSSARRWRRMPEMAHVVAIDTRYVGEAALAAGDRDGARPDREVHEHLPARRAERARRAHRVQRAEPVPPARRGAAGGAGEAVRGRRRCWSRSPATSSTTPSWRTVTGLGFVTETAAYDLCALCEVASEHAAARHDRLLRVFLEIDEEAETQAEERALRGVRKAQAKLATYYLSTRRGRPRARHLRRHGGTSRPSGCAPSATRCWPSRRRTSGRSSTAARTSTTCRSPARNAAQFFAQFPALRHDEPPTRAG